MDAREAALLTLYACEKQGAWSDGRLKKTIREGGLDARDGALATRLCAGVQQNQMLLDYYLSAFSSVKLSKLEDKVRVILRLGLYQLLFLDRIPASAAVNTSVELAKKHARNPRAAGLVNGVLRAITRQEKLPDINGCEAEQLSIQYSHPRWLVEELLSRLGREEAEAVLSCDNAEPPVYAQWNPQRGTLEELLLRLREEGVTAQPHPWLEGCLTLSGTGDLEKLPAFREGRFTVQDPAAKLAVLAAAPAPGSRVLDVCAAPGGKSFAAAMAMEDRGEVLSCDIHPHKQTLIEKGAQRLGLSCVSAHTLDARSFRAEWEGGFDLVIADVPCSGLGVIRKKPDIRYKDPAPLAALPKIQGDILDNVCRYVKPGGVLLYSTCTILRRENEEIVQSFAEKQKDFTFMPFTLPGPIGDVESGQVTLWPHRHGTDGFFIAKLYRERQP